MTSHVGFHLNAGVALLICSGIQAIAYVVTTFSAKPLDTDVSVGISLAVGTFGLLVVNGKFLPRQTMASLLLIAWGVRLARFNVVHGARSNHGTFVIAYQDKRRNAFLISRIVWTLLAMYPTISILTSEYRVTPFNLDECLGATAAAACIYLEHLADSQKQEHYNTLPVAHKFCSTGVWRWSRHANHFFNVCIQWNVFLVVREAVIQHHPYAILGPVLNTAFLIGLPGGILHNERERSIR